MFGWLSKVKIQWFGDRFAREVSDRVDRDLEAAGERWLMISRSLAPFRTGRLRAEEDYEVVSAAESGIKITWGGLTTRNKTLRLIMGAPYDIFQEFGTRYMRPHPHVRPALNRVRIFGAAISMDFARPRPSVWGGLYATGAGFAMPGANRRLGRLTAQQEEHVRRHLIPVSRQHWRGNVRRARMTVRRTP
jgi:HK97 gp10 family phage protein